MLKWKGWSSKYNSWEPVKHLQCTDLIEEFEKQRKSPNKGNTLIFTINFTEANKNTPEKKETKKRKTPSKSPVRKESTKSDEEKSPKKKKQKQGMSMSSHINTSMKNLKRKDPNHHRKVQNLRSPNRNLYVVHRFHFTCWNLHSQS